MFIKQNRGFHGGSSSASTNQSNAFIHPFGGPNRYFWENGIRDRGNDANFLRNIIDTPPHSLGIGKNVAISFSFMTLIFSLLIVSSLVFSFGVSQSHSFFTVCLDVLPIHLEM